jgi:predicted O-methyltransferase YrrM
MAQESNMHTANDKEQLIHNPWMTEAETRWLISLAHQSQSFVEVGCWTGITTRNIATHAPDTTVSAVDNFEGSWEHRNPVSPHFESRLMDSGWLRGEFNKNTSHLMNVFAVPGDSVIIARNALRYLKRFDAVFIDASHEYEDVRLDIFAWLPLVKPGGVICGHDIDWPGVYRAVKELVPDAMLPLKESTLWCKQV